MSDVEHPVGDFGKCSGREFVLKKQLHFTILNQLIHKSVNYYMITTFQAAIYVEKIVTFYDSNILGDYQNDFMLFQAVPTPVKLALSNNFWTRTWVFKIFRNKFFTFVQLFRMFEAQMGMPIDEESGEPIDEMALQKAHYERILSLQVRK